MLCVLSRRQSKDKTALKRSAQRPRASRRGGARVYSIFFFLSLSFSLFLLLSFPFSESARSLARIRESFRVSRGRGSRRTGGGKEPTEKRRREGRRRKIEEEERGRPTLVLLLRAHFTRTTFRHRLQNF